MTLTLLPITQTKAAELPPPLTPEDHLFLLQEQMLRLQNDIYRITQQLDEMPDSPTPPPTTVVDAPHPRIISPQHITVQPGETVEIDLTLRNIGTRTASNVLSQLTTSAGAPFVVEFIGTTNFFSTIPERSQRTIRIRITVEADANPGTHSIDFTHLFRNQAGTNLNATDNLQVRIAGEVQGLSNLEIRNMTAPHGQIGVGQTATISFYVHNTGQAEARNIRVDAAPDTAVIVPVQTSSTQTITSLAPGASQRMTFHFSPRDTAATRSYAIGFTVRYGDTSFEQFASINVYNPEEEDEDDRLANLEIRNMTVPSGVFDVGAAANFSFYVRNIGDAEARNIRVVAAADSAAVVPVQHSSTQVIPVLAPGESQRMTFSFAPTNAADTRSYAIGFTVHYGDEQFQQFAALNAYNPDPEEDEDTPGGRTQIPRVIISHSAPTPLVPRAGHEFVLDVTFRNTSATRSVNNVRILMEEVLGTSIPGAGSHFAGFSPVGGSNTLFIDYIPPHGEYSMTLRFTTVTEASPGAHSMRFSFDYQDQDFYTHTATEAIAISVAQVTRIELSDVHIGGWGMPQVGMPLDFSYNIINSGRVDLINVRVRAEGPFDVQQAGRFIGPLRHQRTTGFDGRLIPLEGGELQGRFIVYGEDMTGEMIEIYHEFTVWVEGGFDDNWTEGGGFHFDGGDMGDIGMIRPEMPMDDMHARAQAWCPVAEDMVEIGYTCPDTYMWVSLGNWCMETGAWIPYDTSFDFVEFISRPIVWGSAAAVGGIGLLVVIIIVIRKRSRFNFDED